MLTNPSPAAAPPKAPASAPTPEQQAARLLKAYRRARAKRQQADEELKALTQQLEALAQANNEWFAQQRTCHFAHGKLAWVHRTEVVLPAELDIEKFYTLFPHCVRLSPNVRAIQQAQAVPHMAQALSQLGVALRAQPQFTVQV
jgi:hypothetical protein